MISDVLLWNKIDAYNLSDLEDGLFFKKLFRENRWDRSLTRFAIKEYKKFIYLAAISNQRVSPSIIVDKVWHMHLIFTDNYWKDFCEDILGKQIHHRPSNFSAQARAIDKSSYDYTLRLYKQEFEIDPDPYIWSNSNKFGLSAIKRNVVFAFFGSISLYFANKKIFVHTRCGTCGSSGASGCGGCTSFSDNSCSSCSGCGGGD